MLSWACLRLYQSQLGLIDGFSHGDCVMLVQLFGKFGSYLTKVSNSFVSLQKGSVSVMRVARLLQLPEQKTLLQQAYLDLEAEPDSFAHCDHDHIRLENVRFEVP